MATLPPGPAAPPAQQARVWLERPLALLDEGFRDFGDVFTLRLGEFGTIVVVAHPDGVESVFRSPSDQFEARHFNEGYRYVMGRHALFLQDGEAHRRLRRVMVPLFGRERVERYARVIYEHASEVAAEWAPGRAIPVRAAMHELSLRVLLTIVFGDRRGARERVMEWFRGKVWRDRRAWKAWTSLSRLRPEIGALISEELEHRRSVGVRAPGADLLDALSLARDESGRALDDEEIQDQVLTLFITAGDAVATALAWALYWVGGSPEVQGALRAESEGSGDAGDPVARAGAPYLTATCREVLRLSTVLPTVSGRRLTTPLRLMGFDLEPGITVAPCEYLVHRRADLYPEPLAFRPGRFLERRYGPFEYFPFGAGDRACLGSALAPLEMKLVLDAVLARWRLHLATEGPVEVVRYGTLLAPSEALQLHVESPLDATGHHARTDPAPAGATPSP